MKKSKDTGKGKKLMEVLPTQRMTMGSRMRMLMRSSQARKMATNWILKDFLMSVRFVMESLTVLFKPFATTISAKNVL